MTTSSTSATTAVILARGLGTRMRRNDVAATLDAGQERVAAAGLKAMMPDAAGRPFLDHLLSALADAGIVDVVLVVAPDHTPIRDHLASHPPQRIRIHFAIQPEPRGTADALLAAEAAVGERAFLVQNADNLYPVAALRALRTLGEPGLVAFARDALLADGTMAPERIAAFALVDIDRDGHLQDLVEKPSQEQVAAAGDTAWVSMNLWRFDRTIFEACRRVPRSSRGEFELPEAVRQAVLSGARFRAVTMRAGVIDLSARGDVAAVAARLAEQPVDP